MTCAARPEEGCSALEWDGGKVQLPYAAGATLFYSTKKALALLPADVQARARRMTCYYNAGFGTVVKGEFPKMRPSGLVPHAPPAKADPAPAHNQVGEDGGGSHAPGVGAPLSANGAASTAPPSVTPGVTAAPPAEPAATVTLHAATAAPATSDAAPFKSLENHAFDGEDGASLASNKELYAAATASAPASFRHALIQTDVADGQEYIFVHALCLDHLVEEEDGQGAQGARDEPPGPPTGSAATAGGERVGGVAEERRGVKHGQQQQGCTRLSWKESIDFVEQLLAPAARPPHVLAVGWRPGDVCIWDNRTTQHSVTPSHLSTKGDKGYAALPNQRRLMTRTAMQPEDWVPAARGGKVPKPPN